MDSSKQQQFIEILDRATQTAAELAYKSGGAEVKIIAALDGVGRVDVSIGNDGSARATTWETLAVARTGAERVAMAKKLLADNKTYPLGCSQFVCEVLGISHEVANDLMGESPVQLGDKPPYTGISPGDIVGWPNSAGSGHVGVYIGESTNVFFIDVREPGTKPRAKNAFYDHMLYKSDRF